MVSDLTREQRLIEEIKKSKYKNINRFAEETGIEAAPIYKMKSGTLKCGDAAAMTYEKLLNLPIGYLSDSTAPLINAKFATITLYNVKACAGDGKENFLEEELEDNIGLPWKILKREGLKPEDIYAVEVDGLSMLPTYEPEDYIFVAKNRTSIKNYEPYLIKYDNELMIKRIEQIAGVITLKSDNQDKNKHPDIVVKEGVQFAIMGHIFKKL